MRLPLINYLIFAAFTRVLLQISLRYPIERSNWRWRSLLYAAGGLCSLAATSWFACWFIR